MDRHEEAVMQFLTANGDTFLSPQYDVVAGWMRPSFVALRPAKKQVWVAEVSASGYPLGLVDKINQRIEKWYAPLLEQLQRLQVTGSDWSIGLMVFVRDDQIDWLKGRIKDMAGVHVLSLETASSPWTWHDSVWTEELEFASAEIPRKTSPTRTGGLTH
ncbi:MAG TPA: hypothetical protein VIG85_07155 [Comamonas sp.]|uniref:hypothetical protein n=1 Tax=Comamonas halotolerans TaxID=3041496 RepID=UPI0024E05149|nr:hypothetical protein [Comamonas sp. NoAH]